MLVKNLHIEHHSRQREMKPDHESDDWQRSDADKPKARMIVD
jgi:hypothetical protein